MCEFMSIEIEIEESVDVMGQLLEAKKTKKNECLNCDNSARKRNIATTSSENSSAAVILTSDVMNHERPRASDGIIHSSNSSTEVGSMRR